MNVDANELLQLAVATARETADLLLASVNTELKIDTKTSATDLVTEIDRAAEKIIVERITIARPQDAILGEEGADRPGTSGVQWIIDPIDGTTNFVYGHPAGPRRARAASSMTTACASPRASAWTRPSSPPAFPSSATASTPSS